MQDFIIETSPSPKIKFYLSLFSDDISIEEISEILGLQANEYWKKGEFTRYNKIKPQESNHWAYSTDYEDSWDFKVQMEKVLSKINTEKLADLIKNKGVIGSLETVVEIYEKAPAIYLDKEMIKFAFETGLEFDFDIYNLKE